MAKALMKKPPFLSCRAADGRLNSALLAAVHAGKQMGNKVTADVPHKHRQIAGSPAVLTQDNIRLREIELRPLFVIREVVALCVICLSCGHYQ